METLKTIKNEVIASMCYFSVLILLIYLLNVRTFQSLCVFLGFVFVGRALFKMFWKHEQVNWLSLGFDYIKTILSVYIIIEMFRISAGFGIAGLIVSILLYSAWRLFGTKKRRENYLRAIRIMETSMFGKPLDKEHWEKGELKKRKIKLVWRKKQ